jgi:hypothetical protein
VSEHRHFLCIRYLCYWEKVGSNAAVEFAGVAHAG